MKNFIILILFLFSTIISYLYFNNIDINTLIKHQIIHKDIQTDKNTTNTDDKNKTVIKNIKTKEINKTKTIPKDATVIKLPEVPKVEAKVPQVVTIGSKKYDDEREKVLPMDMPVIKETKVVSNESNTTKEKSSIGLPRLGRVSTYLRGSYINLDKVKENLHKGNFKVLSIIPINHDNSLKVVVFTDETLLSLATKSPYIASLRILIDKKNKSISITNPYYFAKAYLRDDFDEKKITKVLDKINSSFEGLSNSKDKLKDTLLPEYKFMFGMPNYSDMIGLGSIKDIKSLQNKHNIAFIQKVSKDKYLVGVKLAGSAGGFYKTIGEKNSLLLPYPIMIDGKTVKMLDPKYYIALSYPMLKMSQFMAISSIPDQIQKQCEQIFK